jgi:hypothetical protein
MKIFELKRSGIGLIAEFRGILNGFSNQGCLTLSWPLPLPLSPLPLPSLLPTSPFAFAPTLPPLPPRCRRAAAAATVAFFFIVIIVAVIVAVYVAVATATFT